MVSLSAKVVLCTSLLVMSLSHTGRTMQAALPILPCTEETARNPDRKAWHCTQQSFYEVYKQRAQSFPTLMQPRGEKSKVCLLWGPLSDCPPPRMQHATLWHSCISAEKPDRIGPPSSKTRGGEPHWTHGWPGQPFWKQDCPGADTAGQRGPCGQPPCTACTTPRNRLHPPLLL